MTRADLYDWLEVKGCKPAPLVGINNTANVVKMVNLKFPGAEAYINTPINDKQIPDFAVCKICNELYIDCPECVSDQTPLVKHLDDRFADKKKRL